MKPQPPQWALRFLRWFCRDDYLEEIEGNLLEIYRQQYEESHKKARQQFMWNVLRHFRPAFIRSFKLYQPANHRAMLRHNLILTFRNFQRYKSTFLINLIGLSSGLACALLIFLWVNDELSVDKFHANDERLYQVMKNYPYEGNIDTGEDTPGLLAKALAEEMPEVESAVSVFPPADFTFKGILSVGDTYVKAGSKFADKEFFDIFSYPLLQGSKSQVLSDPSSVVISETLARNLFRTTDHVIGKVVSWKGERHSGDFRVAGIFENSRVNSSIQFDMLFSYDLLLEKFPNFSNWNSNGPSTYVILKKNTELSGFNDKITGFIQSKNAEVPTTLFTRPYSNRYLYGDYENGVLTGGRIAYVRLFSVIAVFILFTACINFMNLSTAKASRRLKEIGVKKAIGASRSLLTMQYLGEAILLTLSSLVLAIGLVMAFLPHFNDITGKALSLYIDKNLLLAVLGITLMTGFIAGSYPAIYLSGFNPLTILKGGGASGNSKYSLGELWTRKGLVVFQFIISISLIMSVLVIYQQMKFIQSKNLGYEKDNIITFAPEGKLAEDPSTFLNEIKNITGVVNASYMRGDLTGLHGGTTALEWEGKDPDKVVDFELIGAGYDLIETLEIEFVEGRAFSRDFGSDSSTIIFNEVAVERMGLNDPVGKTITLWGEEKRIIGVVKNFHFESLYKNVNPLFFQLSPAASSLLVKVKEGSEQKTIAQLVEYYQEYNEGIPFEYQFLDETYQKMYTAEQRVSLLSKHFAAIAILISCLGLFGLAAFTAERRLKEIGIRKALGASAASIVGLLTSDFTKMVLIAIGIALPISYFLAQRWLEDFAFHIDLQWWYFAGAGLLALLIAWITVGLQTVKAARVNPVECLRDE